MIATAMASSSATIWNARARARRVGLTRLETTDTELIIQRMAEALRSSGRSASIRVFGPRAEALNGADFEVWLALEMGYFIGFSIQAKRTTLTARRYLQAATIQQSSGTKARSTSQMDDLIAHGRAVKSNPIHLLYSGWDDPLTDDPLVRGRAMPTQYGATVMPTWWHREATSWPAWGPFGRTRVDPLSDVCLPFEWLFKPEDVREISKRARTANPWFEHAFAMQPSRMAQIFPPVGPTGKRTAVPFDRSNYGRVQSLLGTGLGIAQPPEELVDYAIIGIGAGSTEYGPSAGAGRTAMTRPFDFGLSRSLPAYVLQPIGRTNQALSTPSDALSAPTVSDDDDPEIDDDAASSNVRVESTDDAEQIARLAEAAGTSQIPRVVIAVR